MSVKVLEDPIKGSVSSVFRSINEGVQALDIFNNYFRGNSKITRSMVENVQILGMSEPVRLVDIYSATRVSTTIHRRIYNTEWQDVKSIKTPHRERSSKNVVRAEEFINGHDRVVVLAGPGAGKTTLLKYTALCHLNDELFESSSYDDRNVPFYIHLPDVVRSEKSIDDYVIEKLAGKTDEHARSYVNRVLSKGIAILLLDSLDEVPQDLKEQAYKLIIDISTKYPESKIVLACRVADFDRTLEGFYEVEISRLTDAAIKKIIRAWFKGEPGKASNLIDSLESDNDVHALTETPLLLGLLCIQYASDLNVPSQKTELYGRCIDAFLRSWDTSRGFRRDSIYSSLTDERKRRLFNEVAYNFLITKDAGYIFPEKELVRVIGAYIERFGMSSDMSENVLREIESHHGILEKYSIESYSFSHVSFQEYFSALALVAKHEELKFVKKHLSNSRASSIIIFMVSLMDDPSPVLKHMLQKSDLNGIKNYPAMKKRIDILTLLYKCMNSGVSVSNGFRGEVFHHIARSHILIASIYSFAGVYPFARLEDDGVRYTYFYSKKVRKTMDSTSLSYRKLSNEILMSPSPHYAAEMQDVLNRVNLVEACEKEGIVQSDFIDFADISLRSCMVVPLAGANPQAVVREVDKLKDRASSDRTLVRILDGINSKVTKNYLV